MPFNTDSGIQIVDTAVSAMQNVSHGKAESQLADKSSGAAGNNVVTADEGVSQIASQEQDSKIRRGGSNYVRLTSWTDWIALCMVVLMMIAASILLALSVASSSVFSTINQQHDEQQGKSGVYGESAPSARQPDGAGKINNSLYECELSYLQLDSSMIKFSVDHLIVVDSGHDDQLLTTEEQPFRFDSIDVNSTVDELMTSTRLDPKLPFIFFINGFNTLNAGKSANKTSKKLSLASVIIFCSELNSSRLFQMIIIAQY